MENAFPLFIVLFGLAAIGLVVYRYRARQQRRQSFAAFAAQQGLVYHQEDPFGSLDEPFRLFSKGDGRGIENVLDGTWRDVPIRAFDYWYYEKSSDSNGHTSKTYHRFDCVIAPIEASCSSIAIDRENLFTRLADHLAMDDIHFELEEFNDAFNVKGDDRRFATAFCDQRMMRWLLANAGDHGFEVVGDRLMVFCRKMDVDGLPVLFATMRGFRDTIPAVVYSLYPR